MAREIERKFLVAGQSWSPARCQVIMRQGYLSFGPPVSVRVRVTKSHARLNIKQSTLAIARDEYEIDLPRTDAEEILARHCDGHIIEKTRHLVDFAGKTWEIDVFTGANEGLVIAELELESEDEEFERPPWLGAEVSGDSKYLNSSLAREPYCSWNESPA